MSCQNSTYCNCKTCNAKETLAPNSKMSILPQARKILVLDANNVPMPNVYISNLDTNQGTITNFDGKATIAGNPTHTIEFNHITHDVEQYLFADLPQQIKLSSPHSLDEVTVIGKPKQAGVGIALALAGLGLLLSMKTADTPKQGLNASKPLKVTL